MNSQLIVEQRPRSVQYFFDPLCPFSYQTSLWVRDVAEQTGLKVEWRFFSLQLANHEEGTPYPWEEEWAGSWSLMRVGAQLRDENPEMLDRWYAAVGRAIHEEGRPAYNLEVAQHIVDELGLRSQTIQEALSDPATNEAVRFDHDDLVSRYGGFGVPTLVFPSGKAFYGPVVAPAPSGEQALDLWNLVLQWIAVPNLYEFKAPKSDADNERIKETFKPTFEAQKVAAPR